jgi:hypothetical protein
MNVLASANTRHLPPPLIPLHKGEGKSRTFLPFGRNGRRLQGPPPPCGEGYGVGVPAPTVAGRALP